MANETNNKEFRIESDLLGELQVPANAYYGVQTQRAVNNKPRAGRNQRRNLRCYGTGLPRNHRR